MLRSGFGKLPENDQGRSWCGRQRGVVEETSPRLEGLLSSSIVDVSVLSLDVSHEAIGNYVCSTAAGAACPDCGSDSTQVHSSYLRFPKDVPSGGRLVVLQLRVRRFFCPESSWLGGLSLSSCRG
ncbi:transposase family protein [Streptomyces sp. NBC_01808]|uniref:transposase family protein n=1 Tax=Streptomyces sp. NBC_01808 TaxID=2975947 RepID=UPI002DD9A1E0|nr:transposase family protein [Streptomyces sp. NBC_01808]WSA38916.1 transposase family protein [Streptomyces sp. NBC_01808]